MTKPYQVTMTDKCVCVYVFQRDMTPQVAREFVAELIDHIEAVEDVGKDALEQMA
jgi:hypothetical protein